MANNLLSVWSTVGSVLLAILILLVMITVHEFGHYLVGKLLKFKIDEFSIGFGPAIFKKKRKNSEEIFAVRLIPLGGYCAFAGEDELEEERKEKRRKTEEGGTMSEEGPSKEPFSELSEEARKETSETFILTDAPEEELPARPFEEEHSEEQLPTVVLPVEESSTQTKQTPDDGLFTHKKPWKRILVLLAGAFMNYLLALVFILILLASYGQSLIKVRGIAASEQYSASSSLQAGDILVSLNGKGIYIPSDLYFGLNGKKQGDMVEFEVLRLQEDGSYKEVEVEVMLRGDVTVENINDYHTVWPALGIDIEERGESRYYMIDSTYHRFGFFETVGRSFMYSFKISGSIFRVIGELFTGRLGISSLGGPVTTITTTTEVVSTSGFKGFLEIAAFIGVNLAVFNLLPIPALDGSKIVFTVIEWIRKKPISRKVEAIIHAVGIVLLFAFAIVVDVLHFV